MERSGLRLGEKSRYTSGKNKENIEPRLNTLRCPSELNWVNRKDAKGAKKVFLLVCSDPGRKIQDQNRTKP